MSDKFDVMPGFMATAFILLIIIGLLLSYVSVSVYNHYTAFEENPLIFGAKKYDINTCTCFMKDLSSFSFNQTDIISATGKSKLELNLSELNLTG